MLDIVLLIIPFFGLILLGFASGRIVRHPVEGLAWLNTFVVWLALPALFIKLLAATPVEELTRLDFIATNLGVTVGILLFSFVLGLIESRRVDAATVQGLAGAYGNIGFMGPGLAILAFGEKAAVPVALIFCFENIIHFVFAPMMMALSGKGGGEARPLTVALDVVKKIAFHPFIMATALGVALAFSGAVLPGPVERLVAYLAQAAAPCALFAMGVTLALRPLRRVPRSLGFLLPVKLLVHPLAMYLALTMLGPFDPVWVMTAVMMAALPTATNVFVIAQQYDVWKERASATILATTTLSVLTVAAVLYALKSGLLPVAG